MKKLSNKQMLAIIISLILAVAFSGLAVGLYRLENNDKKEVSPAQMLENKHVTMIQAVLDRDDAGPGTIFVAKGGGYFILVKKASKDRTEDIFFITRGIGFAHMPRNNFPRQVTGDVSFKNSTSQREIKERLYLLEAIVMHEDIPADWRSKVK